MSIEFEWVEDDNRLAELCRQWQQRSAIALDTEFIRSRTFFPKIGLLQIADEQGIYLIDPLAITDVSPLQTLMTDNKVVKVIHSCSEDLDVFSHYLSCLPTPLFDTQIGAAFAGYGASIGYANLVAAIHDQSIPKEETRSDWLQRPLSQSQLGYAAVDVAHLLSVYHVLLTRLQTQQRLAWVESDCQRLLDKANAPRQAEQYYLRIKSAWKLKPHQLAVLKAICVWREQTVRLKDIPRNRMLKDHIIWSVAERLPHNLKQLRKIKEMPGGFVDKNGEQCLDIIRKALDDSNYYPERLPTPLKPDQVNIFKALKAEVNAVADSLAIPPELLARKKDLEWLVRSSESIPDLPSSLQDWRQAIIGQPLLAFLKKQSSL